MNPMLPFDSQIMGSILGHFQKSAVVTSALVALLFTARATLLLISNAPPASYGNLLKDTVLYFVLIGLFPQCFKLMNELIGGLALKFSWESTEQSTGFVSGAMDALKNSSVILSVLSSLGPWVICHFAQSVSTLLVSILVSMGPVVVLLNTMLDFNKGVSSYLVAILGLMLWPLLWNLLGSLSYEIWPSFQETSLMKVIFWVCVQLLQLVSPLFCVVLFSSYAPGRAITSATARIVSKISMGKT